MRNRLHRLAVGSALLAALLSTGALVSPPAAAQENARVERVEMKVSELEVRLNRLQSDVRERRGFIGAQDARNRYESGVYAFLVEDYNQSARIFFSLVESKSLKYDPLQTDAEWYLAESLFEMNNLALADEAYEIIVESGERHPFFADAIRRQMEIYGITNNGERFYELYNTYIVPNRIEPTDIIRYTLAKSFYRQGNYPRAKSMLAEIPDDSHYYGRARYVLGTVLVVEGNYEAAIAEFTSSAGAVATTTETQEVQDLAWLALGRLYYEQGDFVSSAKSYQQVGRESRYFPDALYEIGWTFIKDEDYQQALQAVDIFLLGYEDHYYAPQLRILQGHLHMKEMEYEGALVAYEEVVMAYTPVQEALDEMGRSTSAEWLRHFVTLSDLPEDRFGSRAAAFDRHADELAGGGGTVLPGYAVEMLVNDPAVNRALTVYKELTLEKQDLEESQQIIAELEAALDGGIDELASFQNLRAELALLRADCYGVLFELLQTEAQLLQSEGPSSIRPAVKALEQERDALQENTSDDLAAREFEQIRADMQALRTRYAAQRSMLGGAATNELKRLDTAWMRIWATESQLDETGARMDSQENIELETVRARLDAEIEEVESLQAQLGGQFSEAEALSAEITQAGFHNLSDQFEDHILEADTGIVDVYWQRKTEVSDSLEETKRQKSDELQRLESRFDRIRAGLKEEQ